VQEEHQAIVDALARQDAEGARNAARQHMDKASRRLGALTSR
jgi:DNA-binding FadR family transcriptional regulator